MEIVSSSFIRLIFEDDSSDLQKMEQKAAQVLRSLLNIRESVANVLMVKLTIEVNIGPDSDIVHDDCEKDEERDAYVPQMGDQVVVTSENAMFGNLNLFGMNGTITRAPNRDTDAYMILFTSLTESIPMFRNQFDVTIPFPPF